MTNVFSTVHELVWVHFFQYFWKFFCILICMNKYNLKNKHFLKKYRCGFIASNGAEVTMRNTRAMEWYLSLLCLQKLEGRYRKSDVLIGRFPLTTCFVQAGIGSLSRTNQWDLLKTCIGPGVKECCYEKSKWHICHK